jgi:hypothetical protein
VGKVERFGDGTAYVRAGDLAMAVTWLVDFVVFVVGVAVGILVLAAVDNAQDLDDGVVALGLLALLFGVPLLYGLFYTNGRALGAVLTGTRLVRARDGGRIGAKGPWAMLVRTILLPVLFVAIALGEFVSVGSLARVSIDVARTRRLHADEVARAA